MCINLVYDYPINASKIVQTSSSISVFQFLNPNIRFQKLKKALESSQNQELELTMTCIQQKILNDPKANMHILEI
jgi:hypothetical protein